VESTVQELLYYENCSFVPRVNDDFQFTQELVVLDPSKSKVRMEFVCQLFVLLVLC
jgi:hypothetical protein